MKINIADKWFSIFIRLRDADEYGIVTCCTCNKQKHWKDVDCGHYIKRQHQATRYDERNCHAQCKACNYMEQGAEAKHEQHIEKLYGRQIVHLLKSAKRHTCNRSQLDLQILSDQYKFKAKELAEQKGIQL